MMAEFSDAPSLHVPLRDLGVIVGKTAAMPIEQTWELGY
jgi:hypothetical protein